MKKLYKVLFSLCSTVVCAVYSVRAFAASCTTHAVSEPLSTDVVLNNIWADIAIQNCVTWDEFLVLNSTGYVNGVFTHYYDRYASCTRCGNKYLMLQETLRPYTKESRPGTCELEIGHCTLDPDKADCTRLSDCETAEKFYTDASGEYAAYATLTPTACRNGICLYSNPLEAKLKLKVSSWGLYTTSTADVRVTCMAGRYDGGGAILNSSGAKFWVTGCNWCPEPDAIFLGGAGNYYYGPTTTPGTIGSAGCYISGDAVYPLKFEDDEGIFEISGDCYY